MFEWMNKWMFEYMNIHISMQKAMCSTAVKQAGARANSELKSKVAQPLALSGSIQCQFKRLMHIRIQQKKERKKKEGKEGKEKQLGLVG